MKTEILKCVVGSQAHGLATPDSDWDFRAVYVEPTSTILSIGHSYKGSSWLEGDNQDQTAWELGHFLMLALKNNPTILEVFKSPIKASSVDGEALRELFPYVYNPKQAYDAFCGYSINQRKKMLDKKDNRMNKYACAYIRTLYNLNELLETNDFSVEIKDKKQLDILKDLKYNKELQMGFVIDLAEELQEVAKMLLPKATSKYSPEVVNDFLIDVRKRYW